MQRISQRGFLSSLVALPALIQLALAAVLVGVSLTSTFGGIGLPTAVYVGAGGVVAVLELVAWGIWQVRGKADHTCFEDLVVPTFFTFLAALVMVAVCNVLSGGSAGLAGNGAIPVILVAFVLGQKNIVAAGRMIEFEHAEPDDEDAME